MRDGRALKGLSSAEARARLARDGPNEIADAKRRGLAALAGEILREPMILLLVASGAIYFALGDPAEAAILLASIVAVIGISLLQSRRTERSLEKLRDLASPRARVIRDSAQTRIAGREVVRGDLLIVSEGDRVAADGEIRWLSNLSVDESLLTGRVRAGRQAGGDTGGRERPPTRPRGSSRVRSSSPGRASPRSRRPDRRPRWAASARPSGRSRRRGAPSSARSAASSDGSAWRGSPSASLIVVFYARSRGNLLEGLLAGLAVAMSVLPEEFPVVLTVFLALGAWRISRQQVLTRRIPAVEALGAATVLCVDKTGTLTLNRMAVARLVAADRPLEVDGATALPDEFHELVEFAILASQRTPFDPMEQAIREFGLRTLARTEHLHEDWELLREYPLSPELLAVSHAWRARGLERFVVAAKGAPEAIADLCHLPEERDSPPHLAASRSSPATGCASSPSRRPRFEPSELPPRSHDFPFELLGLVGLEDPLRPSARGGDRGRPVGRDPRRDDHGRLSGHGLAGGARDRPARRRSDDRGRSSTRSTTPRSPPGIGGISVFARIVPAQKLRLVEALKARGEVVVMTGDGVNDAPALKAAHIGIAMGGRGTDVAREAAALVLLDDDFASIVEAIRLGRRIFDNLKKATAYLVAVHVPIAGMALAPVLLGWPLLLLPVQIVFLELIIDPVSSIAFEAEPAEDDVMRRPPRPPARPAALGPEPRPRPGPRGRRPRRGPGGLRRRASPRAPGRGGPRRGLRRPRRRQPRPRPRAPLPRADRPRIARAAQPRAPLDRRARGGDAPRSSSPCPGSGTSSTSPGSGSRTPPSGSARASPASWRSSSSTASRRLAVR